MRQVISSVFDIKNLHCTETIYWKIHSIGFVEKKKKLEKEIQL